MSDANDPNAVLPPAPEAAPPPPPPPPAPAPRPAPLDDAGLDLLFREARTHYRWSGRDVTDGTLRKLYDLVKMGPTSANTCPGRFVFVRSDDGKAKLKGALSPGNVEKTMTAPVTVIVAYDTAFYDHLPYLYPQADARSWFANNWSLGDETAQRNSALQGAYLIMAARALGLDVGPMSGFDRLKVDDAFFAGTTWRSNFLVNLGYGEATEHKPRNPRLSFDEAARLE